MYCSVRLTGSYIRDCPFVLCIVLSVSLDRPFGIAPSSCVLYCQFHWIVHSGLPLRPVYSTVSFTGSSIRDCPFVLCIVLSVSLDRSFGIAPSSCVLYCQFYLVSHSGLPLRPEYCTVSFTGSSIPNCPFVLCIVLSVSLDRPFGIAPSSWVLYCQFHWIVHSGLPLRPVYCTVSFTGSCIRDCPFVLCIVLSVSLDCPFEIAPSSCVLYCQFHWIVHSGLPLRPVYSTVSFTGSFIRDCPFVLCIVLSVSLDRPFGIAPSSCVLYSQFHWISHSGLPLRPEDCTVSFTGSSIPNCPFVLCIVLSVSLDRPFGIVPSSCVLYCQFHWIVHSGLPLRPVYCTVSFTRLSIRDCPFVLFIVLSVSLDRIFEIAPSSCVLYCQFHWIVHSGLPLRPVYCTVSFTGLSIRDCPFVLCIVLSGSLDRPFGIAPSSCVFCTVSFTGSSIRDCPFAQCIVLSVSLDRPFEIALSDFSNIYIIFSLTLECDLLPRYHVNLNGYIIYRFIKIHKRDVLIFYVSGLHF